MRITVSSLSLSKTTLVTFAVGVRVVPGPVSSSQSSVRKDYWYPCFTEEETKAAGENDLVKSRREMGANSAPEPRGSWSNTLSAPCNPHSLTHTLNYFLSLCTEVLADGGHAQVCWSTGSQRGRAAVSASPGNMVEMHLGSQPRLTEPETLGLDPALHILMNFPGDSVAH